jgi:hypothetical protein
MVQALAAAPEMCPSGHVSHVTWSVVYLPAVQSVHVACFAAEIAPAGHSSHRVLSQVS